MLKSLVKNLFFYKYFNFVLFFSLFLYSGYLRVSFISFA